MVFFSPTYLNDVSVSLVSDTGTLCHRHPERDTAAISRDTVPFMFPIFEKI